MKRLTAIVLCLSLALSLAACGAAAPAPEPSPAPLFPTEAPTPTAAPAPTAPADMTEASTEDPVEDYTLADLALVNNEVCAFTVTGTEFNEHLGMQIHVLCENKSDRTLTFTWNNTSVCGFMYDPYWTEDVAGGKKVNSTIGIDTYALEQMGITSVDEVVFTLLVQDSEEFMNEPAVNEGHVIYPTGKTPDQVVYPVYEPKEEDTVIVSNDTLTFIIENVDDELADFYILNCYMANHTGKNLMVSWDNVSVNGFMVDPYWSGILSAGNQAYTTVIFYRSDLEAQDIEVVQEVEFNLLVSDYDDWDAAYLLDEVYRFVPKQ